MRIYKCDICYREIDPIHNDLVTFEGYEVCKSCSSMLDEYVRELTDRIREVIFKNTTLVANKDYIEDVARRIIAETSLPKN